jgi:Type I phosphodiesterase / nucleotide pyrophosphatase
MYLKLDQEIAVFLKHLDEKFGKDNVLVFLTADHGAVETPTHMNSLDIPAGVFSETTIEDDLELALKNTFGAEGNYIHDVNNQQVWLNKEALADRDIKISEASEVIMAVLKTKPGVYDAFTHEQLMQLPPEYPFVSVLRRGIHPSRSGDIIFQLDPGWHADDNFFKWAAPPTAAPTLMIRMFLCFGMGGISSPVFHLLALISPI